MDDNNNNIDNHISNTPGKESKRPSIILIVCFSILVLLGLYTFLPRIIKPYNNYNYEHLDINFYGPSTKCKKIEGGYNKENIVFRDDNTLIIKDGFTYKAFYIPRGALYDLGIPTSDDTVDAHIDRIASEKDVIIGLYTKDGYYKLNNCKYYFKGQGYKKYKGVKNDYLHRVVFYNEESNHILFGNTYDSEEYLIFYDEIDRKLGKVLDIDAEFLENGYTSFLKVTVYTEGSYDGLDSHWFIYLINPRGDGFKYKGRKIISYDDNVEYHLSAADDKIYIKEIGKGCYILNRFDEKTDDPRCYYY